MQRRRQNNLFSSAPYSLPVHTLPHIVFEYSLDSVGLAYEREFRHGMLESLPPDTSAYKRVAVLLSLFVAPGCERRAPAWLNIVRGNGVDERMLIH